VLPLAVSFLILFLLSLKIDVGKTADSLRGCDLRLVGLAVTVSLFVNILVGAEKWRRILAALGCSLSFRETVSIRTACIPFKILLPLKSSELLKAVYLDRRRKLSFTRATGSLIIDKAFNVLIIIPIAAVGLAMVELPVSRSMLFVLLSVILVLILLTVYSVMFRQGLIGLASKIHPRLNGFAVDLLSGFAEIGPGRKTILMFYSFIFQSSEFINTFILLKAVGVTVPIYYLMVIIPVIMIINNLPITVLGLGTREIAIVYFFSAFGPAAALLSAGILVSLVEYVLPVLTGLLFISSFQAYFVIKNDALFIETAAK
jgi:uncharacterized protein (TIRG00374 family)